MFVFDNLIELDDRGMQELLRQVPSDRLLLAMKGADEELKEKIFKNMSQRAAEMLRTISRRRARCASPKWRARRRKSSRRRASSPKPARSRSAARARRMSDTTRASCPATRPARSAGRRPRLQDLSRIPNGTGARSRSRAAIERAAWDESYAAGKQAGLAAGEAAGRTRSSRPRSSHRASRSGH